MKYQNLLLFFDLINLCFLVQKNPNNSEETRFKINHNGEQC